MYQSRLDEFKMKYLNVENSIELLNEKIHDINSEITIIEDNLKKPVVDTSNNNPNFQFSKPYLSKTH